MAFKAIQLTRQGILIILSKLSTSKRLCATILNKATNQVFK